MAFDPTKIDWDNIPVLGADGLTGPSGRTPAPQPSKDIGGTPAWLRYKNQHAIRKLPLNSKLVGAMDFLPELGVTMEVFSGGQPSEGPDRTGSHRHDDGGSGDVFFYKDGRKLDWANDQDRPVFEEIVRRARSRGVTGFGAGANYMQPGSMHLGFGKEAVWGAGGRGVNAPQWLRDAYHGASSAPQAARAEAVGGNIKPGPENFERTPQLTALSALDLIRSREGFRANAYWDEDHYRAGYGSDTITRSDGTVERVRKGTVVTRADADRDLQRREAEARKSAARSVGVAAWDNLPDLAQSALVDVAYNYGSLPDRLHASIQSGDLNAVADAVEALGADNGGINRERRLQEAQMIRASADGESAGGNSETDWGEVSIIGPDGSITRPQQIPDARAKAAGSEDHLNTQQYFQKLEQESPGRYQMIPADQYEAWHEQWQSDQPSQFNKGFFGALIDQNPELAGNFLDAMGVLFDSDTLHGAAETAREYGRAGAEKRQPNVPSLANIRTDSVGTFLDDLGDYTGYMLGQGMGSMAAPAAAAAVGGAAGAAVSGPGGVVTGMLAGSAGTSYTLNLGDIYGSLKDDPGVQAKLLSGEISEKELAGIAAVAAIPMAALDVVGLETVAGIGAKPVKDAIVKRILKGLAKGAIAEGSTEGLQEAISQGVQVAVGGDLDAQKRIMAIVDNAFAGGLAGGAVGGAAHVRPGSSETDIQAAPETVTEDRQPRKGPLSEALDHGARATAEQAGATFVIDDPAIGDLPAGDLNGVEISVSPDQSGVQAGMRRVVLPDGRQHVLGERLLKPVAPADQPDVVAADNPVNPAVPDGAPAAGTDVRIEMPGSGPIMGKVQGYADGEAIAMDTGTGEVLQVPLDAISLSPGAARAEQDTQQPTATPDDNLPGSEPIPPETKNGDLPPKSETGTISDVPYRTPKPGQRVIVDAEGIDRFPATVQSYEEGAQEALVKRDDGTEVQVPVGALRVSRVSDKENEKKDLAENPPVKRETITDMEPTAREVRGAQIVLPDAAHARLYDLGKLRRDSKQTVGKGTLDMDAVSPGEQSRLADEFGLSQERLGQIADDYRFRVERAAKQANSRTPIKMYPVNAKLLDRMKVEDRREAKTEAPGAPEVETITPDDFRAQIAAANDDMRVASAALVEKIKAALDAGSRVTLWSDGKPIQITAIERGMMQSADGLRWGTMSLANGNEKVGKNAIDIEPPAAADVGIQETSKPKPISQIAADWDKLPTEARKAVLKAAGIKRPASTSWADFSATIRSKIEASQESSPSRPLAPVDKAIHEAATSPHNNLTEPTQPQKEAGNYKLGHVTMGGFDISIENPKGSKRSGVDRDGKPWSIEMKSHYGYFKGTVGKDKDHIDLFMRPGTEALGDGDPVFVIDQVEPTTGQFDEHKVMLGYKNKAQASRAYKANYANGWKGMGTMTETTVGELKQWFAEGATSKPFGKEPAKTETPKKPGQRRAAEPAAPPNPKSENAPSPFAENKLFTEDKVKAARARLRKKLNQVSSGVDPEVLIDGMTIAGAYIEAGVRKFSDYAKAMIDDLGVNVRPFLLSFYEGARNYPGLDTTGMDSVEDAKSAYDAIMAKPGAKAKAVTAPVESAPPALTAAKNAPYLTDTPGVEAPQETQADEPARSARDVQRSDENKGAKPVQENGGRRGTVDLFEQSNRPVVGERQRGAEQGDSRHPDRGQPAVPGEPAESAAGAEQRVQNRGGSRDGTGSGTDRRSQPRNRDYRIAAGELTREGSWRKTAERNVEIVELVKRLEKEGRVASPEERALMVQYTGWGAGEIANGIFPNSRGGFKDEQWQALGARLKAALTDDEYKTAARSTQYAHYTSEPVIRSIFSGLKRIGFAGGAVLEPGMGIGHFRGLMPDAMFNSSTYTGIEFDGITAAIAKHIYPDSRVIHGDYTVEKMPKDFFDAAIGNPPFAQTKITNDPEYRKYGFSLHDYFFAKTIDRVKPGGLMVFVTSRYTMDKIRDAGRKYLAERSNLLGAIRLPQTAFKANAGTEVVTDVIFLQKRGPGVPDNGIAWSGTKEIQVNGQPKTVNEYIADHPEMVLGKHSLTGSMYRADEYTVEPYASKNIEKLFADAIDRLPESVYRPERGSKAEQAKVVERDFDPKAKKEGGLYLNDAGELMIREDGTGRAFTSRQTSSGSEKDLSPRETKFLRNFVKLRDAIKQTQFDQLTDGDWEKSLKAAQKAYRDMVKENGPLLAYSEIERTGADGETTSYKRFKNEPLFMLDPDGPIAFTVEKITEAGNIVPGPVLSERVLNKPSEPEIVTTQDAMFVALNRSGRFDIDEVAKLAGKSKAEAIRELGTSIYEDPGAGWVLADEYLSGNVVQKLAEAQSAAMMDKRFERNVKGLETVQPKPLAASEIDVRLGAPWVPAADVEAFAREVFDDPSITVGHNLKVGTWNISGSRSEIGQFAMDGLSAASILSKVLNNSSLRVTRTVRVGEKVTTEVDPAATEKLNDIARKMRDRFRTWIWQDQARTKRLVNFYNDNYNNIAPRSFDGSHLTLPGTSLRFNLHPHQKRTIWRAIQTGDTYIAHAVGAGKTFEMIAIGMEERRLGLIKKPLYIVPNHMLGQFSREFLELYPAANIMVADEKNFHTSNRRKFIAQAALNDPDAIIITHSAFSRIGLSDAENDRQIQSFIDDWQELQDEIRTEEGEKSLSFKRAQRQIESLEKRLVGKQKREAKDKVMTFEELGADRLIVDEMHEFRKLEFATNQGTVKGIDPQGSQRAMDLYAKVTYLRRVSKDPQRVLVGASGTPVTNTMGELFTVQRFFQPDELENIGVHNFDAWASQFGEIVEGLEQNAAGNFVTVSRFAKFQNVPELMRRVRTFMDILTSSNLGELVQRPTRINPPREIKVTPAPKGYKAYQQRLQQRMNAIKERKGPPQKGDDIVLKVISDGRFSAIDMRFVDPTLGSDPASKLNQIIDDVIADYKATADNVYVDTKTGQPDPLKGSTLVVFSDIGLGEGAVKARGFDMKEWIVKRLTDAGVSKEHIAFIRDYKSHAKKERLFADIREGKRRILIGGKDMETGVNVQKRLTHLYHVDAPWFPASVEQREGRGDRQGNQNSEIRIRGYASKGSYDSTMWAMNARKARFIEQALNGDETVRKMEDVSEASAFEMAAALSSGDPRYLQLAGLRQEVERLGRLRSAHYDEQNRYKREEHHSEGLLKKLDADREALEEAANRGSTISAGAFTAKVGKISFEKRDEWSKAIHQAFVDKTMDKADGVEKLGEIAGHNVVYYGVIHEDGSYQASLSIDLPGNMADLAEVPAPEDFSVAGIGARAVNQVNSIPGALEKNSEDIKRTQRRLQQIRSQVGAPFPEESIYLEKQSELSDLEAELQAEADRERQASQAETSTKSAKEIQEDRYSKQDPVIRLTGEEIWGKSAVSSDRRELRIAAQKWYRENLVGKKVTTREGMEVTFAARSGLKKTTYGAKGNELLQSVPAIPAIIEHGSVLLREPGNRDHVAERLVIGAPVEISGKVRRMAVTILKTRDGNWHYDLHHDRGTESPGEKIPGAPGPTKLSRHSALEGALGGLNLFEWQPYRKGSADLVAALETGPAGHLIGKLLQNGSAKIVETRPTGMPEDAQAWTDAHGTITLLASAIEPDNASAVLLHEGFHIGRDALFNRQVWKSLEKRLAALYHQHERSTGRARAFFEAARVRVANDGATGSLAIEEFGAYALEEYERAPKTLQRWADDAIGAVKAWVLRRFGRQIGQVTPGELRAIAIAALRDRSGGAMTAPAPAVAEKRFSRSFDRQDIVDQLQGRWTDLSPKLLSLVPLNYFSELKRPGMRAIDKYLKIKRAMDTYRAQKHEDMDGIAQTWRKFAAKDNKSAKALAELMHDSTLASIDPTVDYGKMEPRGFAAMRARFDALPAAARGLYKTVRNAYVKTQAEIDQLILDNLEKTQAIAEKEAKKRYEAAKARVERDRSLDEVDRREKMEDLHARYKADLTKSRWAHKARATRLREVFEKNRVPVPYFPLARFGDYFVTVRDMAGDVVSFSRFESDADRRRWLRKNKANIEQDFPGVVFEAGVLGNPSDMRKAMDPRLVAEIEGILKNANVDDQVMDAIYQKWLESMPDLSIRKRYIHRKGTTGFQEDALRAFAFHMFHAGHQMGKLKYAIDLQEAVDEARDQAQTSDDPTRAGQLVNELVKRQEWVMNPKGSRFAQMVNSAAFVWYLAATPAAAIVNMTQPILVGVPVLGARLGGMTKASTALLKASSDIIYGRGDISRGRLTDDEKKAIQALYASGSIDRTMTMEIAGIGDSGVRYSPLRHQVMKKISWLFHNAEVVNREVTALAAYRMARNQGQSHTRAVDTAHELNFTVNYDYANSSRPRILQSDFAKVAGVFMSYQLNVWYRIFRDIHQSFAADSRQARKEARYQLGGLMAVQALMGGASGFFMYNALMAIAGLFLDDEDDPFSFKQEAEKAIFDLFGDQVGGMIVNGVPGHLLGINLTSRIGMADFFLRMPEASKEGRDWWMEFVAGSLGASVGAVGNAVVGAHYMSQGDVERGLELMAPKAIKDLMKAWRYANEGLLTRKGDIILPKEDISAWDVVKQAAGFAPAKVATAHKLRGAKYEAQNRIKKERQELVNRFAAAVRNHDPDARKRAIQQIVAWNKRSYAKVIPITRDTLERSLKMRAKLAARRDDGFLPINERIGHYLSERSPDNPYR